MLREISIIILLIPIVSILFLRPRLNLRPQLTSSFAAYLVYWTAGRSGVPSPIISHIDRPHNGPLQGGDWHTPSPHVPTDIQLGSITGQFPHNEISDVFLIIRNSI